MADRVQRWSWNLQRSELNAINQNADELDLLEGDVASVKSLAKQQAEHILWLRSTVLGLLEVLHHKGAFEDAELDNAVRAAHMELTAPPVRRVAARAGDPYRGGAAAGDAAAPPVKLRACSRCRQEVAASRITVFPDGEVCDACL